jgi:hypothetical protein
MAKRINYFTHDYNARNDPKMVKLLMKYGVAGIGLYWCIIEMLNECNGKVLRSEYERIAFELRVDIDLVKSLIGSDLFTSDESYFWSESVLRRLSEREEKRAKTIESVTKRWDEYRKKNTNVLRPEYESNTIKDKDKDKDKEESIIIGETPKPQLPKKSKQEVLEIERAKFQSEVQSYSGKYSTDMLKAFYTYWSEANLNTCKMNWQTKKTWETGRRLATWHMNETKGFKK